MTLYSRKYIELGKLGDDSERARRRVFGYFFELSESIKSKLPAVIRTELGVEVPSSYYDWNFEEFFQNCELRDFLDSITLIAELLKANYSSQFSVWVAKISRIFLEENLFYRIDSDGSIHPLVDAEFEQSRLSILESLASSKFVAAHQSLEICFKSLKPDGTGTLDAVRYAFDAAENVFKQQTGASRLGSKSITESLVPRIKSKYSGRAADASKLLLSAFGKHADGAHSYRHADTDPDPTPPPFEVAVAFVSLSVAFIRFLLDLTEADMIGDPR